MSVGDASIDAAHRAGLELRRQRPAEHRVARVVAALAGTANIHGTQALVGTMWEPSGRPVGEVTLW